MQNPSLSFFPKRSVSFCDNIFSDTPKSPLDELKNALTNKGNEGCDDGGLEASLSCNLERIFACGQRSNLPVYHRARRPADSLEATRWTEYLARFIIHFVKGLFVGAGMYTTNRLLVTHRLQHFLQDLFAWIFHQAYLRNDG